MRSEAICENSEFCILSDIVQHLRLPLDSIISEYVMYWKKKLFMK